MEKLLLWRWYWYLCTQKVNLNLVKVSCFSGTYIVEGVITYIFRGTSNYILIERDAEGGVITYIFRGTSNEDVGDACTE